MRCHCAVRQSKARPEAVVPVDTDKTLWSLSVPLVLVPKRFPNSSEVKTMFPVTLQTRAFILKQVISLSLACFIRMPACIRIICIWPCFIQVKVNWCQDGCLFQRAGQFPSDNQSLELRTKTIDSLSGMHSLPSLSQQRTMKGVRQLHPINWCLQFLLVSNYSTWWHNMYILCLGFATISCSTWKDFWFTFM